MSNDIMGGTQSLSVAYVAKWDSEGLVISLPCGTEYRVTSPGEDEMIEISTPGGALGDRDPIVRDFCVRVFAHCASGRGWLARPKQDSA